jgi:hypothetical protein
MQAIAMDCEDVEELSASGVGGLAEEAVQEKLAEYRKRVAAEGELGEADLAELESMAPDPDREEKVWQVCLHVLRN